MRPAPQWHQLGTARLARERSILVSLPYFGLERTFLNDDYFTAIGALHHRGHRSGKKHEMRIRLKYPRTFPRMVQNVIDHDRIFVPNIDGHLFSTHQICLTLPERNEFTIGSEQLTEEVLSATLVWFHKRRLFDRTGTWPGPAERHGANALIDLLVDKGILQDEDGMRVWLREYAMTTAGRYQEPDRYAPCPCGSQKAMKFCHGEALRALFKRLSATAGVTLIANALAVK